MKKVFLFTLAILFLISGICIAAAPIYKECRSEQPGTQARPDAVDQRVDQAEQQPQQPPPAEGGHNGGAWEGDNVSDAQIARLAAIAAGREGRDAALPDDVRQAMVGAGMLGDKTQFLPIRVIPQSNFNRENVGGPVVSANGVVVIGDRDLAVLDQLPEQMTHEFTELLGLSRGNERAVAHEDATTATRMMKMHQDAKLTAARANTPQGMAVRSANAAEAVRDIGPACAAAAAIPTAQPAIAAAGTATASMPQLATALNNVGAAQQALEQAVAQGNRAVTAAIPAAEAAWNSARTAAQAGRADAAALYTTAARLTNTTVMAAAGELIPKAQNVAAALREAETAASAAGARLTGNAPARAAYDTAVMATQATLAAVADVGTSVMNTADAQAADNTMYYAQRSAAQTVITAATIRNGFPGRCHVVEINQDLAARRDIRAWRELYQRELGADNFTVRPAPKGFTGVARITSYPTVADAGARRNAIATREVGVQTAPVYRVTELLDIGLVASNIPDSALVPGADYSAYQREMNLLVDHFRELTGQELPPTPEAILDFMRTTLRQIALQDAARIQFDTNAEQDRAAEALDLAA